jgi:hypothetical protein
MEQAPMSFTASTWEKIVRPTLPGIFFLILRLYENQIRVDYTFAWNVVAAGIPVLACALVCVAGFVRERRFPAWSYTALGVLVGTAWLYLLFGAISLVNAPPWLQRAGLPDLGMLLAFGALYLLAPILIGFGFARQTRELAGLIVVGAVYLPWAMFGGPGYALPMYTDNQVLVMLVTVSPELFFLILAPALVLNLRSNRERIVGYLACVGGGLMLANGIGSLLRPYDQFAWTIGRDLLLAVLPLMIALAAYSRVGRKTNLLNAV